MGRFSGMEISSTRGMKKFSYLKTTVHSEIVFLYELTKQKFCEIVNALVKRNQISAWAIWKSDFSLLVQLRFHEFSKSYGNLLMANAYTNSYHTGIIFFFIHTYFPKKEVIVSKITDFKLTMAAVR